MEPVRVPPPRSSLLSVSASVLRACLASHVVQWCEQPYHGSCAHLPAVRLPPLHSVALSTGALSLRFPGLIPLPPACAPSLPLSHIPSLPLPTPRLVAVPPSWLFTSLCSQSLPCFTPVLHLARPVLPPAVTWSTGGFPCVLYSDLNRFASEDDILASISLFDSAFEYLRFRHPPAFIFENVASLMSSRLRFVVDHFLSMINLLGGYHIYLSILCSHDFGANMTRPRLIVVALRLPGVYSGPFLPSSVGCSLLTPSLSPPLPLYFSSSSLPGVSSPLLAGSLADDSLPASVLSSPGSQGVCTCLRGCTRPIDTEYSWTGPYCSACTSDGVNCECGEYNDDTPICCLLPEGPSPSSVPPSPPGSDAGSDDDLRRSTGFGGFSGTCCFCCPAPSSPFLTSFLFLTSYQGVWGLCC